LAEIGALRRTLQLLRVHCYLRFAGFSAAFLAAPFFTDRLIADCPFLDTFQHAAYYSFRYSKAF